MTTLSSRKRSKAEERNETKRLMKLVSGPPSSQIVCRVAINFRYHNMMKITYYVISRSNLCNLSSGLNLEFLKIRCICGFLRVFTTYSIQDVRVWQPCARLAQLLSKPNLFRATVSLVCLYLGDETTERRRGVCYYVINLVNYACLC